VELNLEERPLEGFSLSPQQRRLWLLGARPSGSPYRAECAIVIEGPIDAAAFAAALRIVAKRHEILRTDFRCLPEMALPVQVVSEEGAALDAVLRPLSPESHLLLLSVPALCLDTESLAVLLRELRDGYAVCAYGEPVAEVKFQYADLSGWMNGLLRDDEAREEKHYWREKLVNPDALTRGRLPFEREIGAGTLAKPEYVATSLASASEAAGALAEALGVPLSAVLLACWQLFLHRITGNDEFLLGIASAGRTYDGLGDALGLFEKYLPLECRVNDRMPPRDFVRSVAEAERDAHARQEFFSWEDALQGAVHFIPYCFSFYQKPEPLRAGALSFSLSRGHCDTDRFSLKLVVVSGRNELAAEFHYDPDAFRRTDIERLAAGFSIMLRSLLGDTASAVRDLEAADAMEWRRHSHDWSRRNFPSGRLLHQLFEERARGHPQEIAVAFGDEVLTVAELNAAANRLAWHLRVLGVAPGSLVPIVLDRSLESVVCLLGVLKAGGAYVALDPAQPDERFASIFAELSPSVVLTEKKAAARFEREGLTVVCMDRDREAIARHSVEDVDSRAAAEDLCYVLFTSGSTGSPKGVAVEHRQVLNYLYAITERLSLEPGASYATVSSLAGDLGNTAIFPALAMGACLHLIPAEIYLSPDRFAEYATRHRIDCLKIVPSHLAMLLTARDPARVLPEKLLVIGGEALPPQLVERVRTLQPRCTVVNHYGPSETTVGVLTLQAAPSHGDTSSSTVPLGFPLANTQVYILDSRLRPVPEWVTGEIYLGGSGLARGYFGQPGLTAERFIANPFSEQPGARLYRTGDAGRFLPDGSVEFRGRVDFQVKVRGYRIEVEEVEARLCAHHAVACAVVVPRAQENGDVRLEACIVAAQGSELSASELKSFLAEHLPDYMLPSAYFVAPAIPLTPNGKVDRRAVASGRYANLGVPSRAVSPRSEAERAIAGIWQEVLGLDSVGVYDNFFDLGGHSLLLGKVHARLTQMFDRPLTVIDLFTYSTVSSLSEFLIDETERWRFETVSDRAGKQKEAINRQRQRLDRQRQRLGKREQ